VIYSDANDDKRFLKEVELIKRLGFNGKSLINPRQIELLHNAYAPTEEEVEYAGRVVAAAVQGERDGLGVVSLGGKMIDRPVIAHAHRVLQRAEASGTRK
jgi:citrate lyase subunit beta/citryl-CoA lyase